MPKAERRLFNTLRDWRAEKAHDEGVPRYLVFNNAELVRLIRKRPTSRTAFTQIDGIGPKKTERYADELLALLNDTQDAPPPREDDATPKKEDA